LLTKIKKSKENTLVMVSENVFGYLLKKYLQVLLYIFIIIFIKF